jgi:hypothetical protein
MTEQIHIGETDGARWAAWDGWRVKPFTEGGYMLNRWVYGPGWVLTTDMPERVERMLCRALAIDYVEG